MVKDLHVIARRLAMTEFMQRESCHQKLVQQICLRRLPARGYAATKIAESNHGHLAFIAQFFQYFLGHRVFPDG